MLNRFKPEIWYFHRLQKGDNGYQDDGIERFGRPVKRLLNYRGMSSGVSLVAGGELNTGTIVGRQLRGHPDKYFEGDRLLIGESPEYLNEIENNANYRIISVVPMHNIVEIVAERLINEES